MRIPVYRCTIAHPVFYTHTACLTHVNFKSNMHQTVQFLAFLSLFSWDNFTGTSPITNKMADAQLRFQFGRQTLSNFRIIDLYSCNSSKVKLLLHYMGFWLLFTFSGVIELE